MEIAQSTRKKKSLYSHEESLIPKVNTRLRNRSDCGEVCQAANHCNNILLDLEILPNNTNSACSPSNRVLVVVESRGPQVQTLYLTDKDIVSESARKDTEGSIATTTVHEEPEPSYYNGSESYNSDLICQELSEHTLPAVVSFADNCTFESISDDTDRTSKRCSQITQFRNNNKSYVCTDTLIKRAFGEKCYYTTNHTFKMNPIRNEPKADKAKKNATKSDKATLIITNTSSEDSIPSNGLIDQLQKRIENLERKVLRQELVFRGLHPSINNMSSVESVKNKNQHEAIKHACYNSFIDQYSHVPETSAFQRFSQQPTPSTSTRKTIEKEHTSEQYGRDFTTYDGITNTRNKRRESASMPLNNRCEALNVTTTTTKTRTKPNPVRDYRLMDTVHYLAQGEFAPRNDGIKLTPSREAVLSDIIWEDVCRSHWPNARLTRRLPNGKAERSSHRSELQRHIDNLLRERITHIERRRRRHYRVMKVNHDNEKSRTLGKTGDIIVASNNSANKKAIENEATMVSDMIANTYELTQPTTSKNSKAHESTEGKYTNRHKSRQDNNCAPGPSNTDSKKSNQIRSQIQANVTLSPMCTTSKYDKIEMNKPPNYQNDPLSGGSSDAGRAKYTTNCLNPKLVLSKKDPFKKKGAKKEIHSTKEHYILLPTLVVKTPSTISKPKKYNHLYKSLHVNLENRRSVSRAAEPPLLLRSGHSVSQLQKPNHKDIGLNVNITHTTSEEDFTNK